VLAHRLIAGTLLATGIGAVLLADDHLAPVYPCLLAAAVLIGLVTTHELVGLLPAPHRPPRWLAWSGVLAVLLANWGPVAFPHLVPPGWSPVVAVFAAVVILAFLVELARYRVGGGATARLAHFVLVVAFLGLLPSFLLRLRWADPAWATLALTLTIFVPKVGDIGAYFTGRLLGRTPLAPVISPKKTREGFIGGLAASVATAIGLSFAGPVFRHGIPEAVAFGVVIGIASVLGDLAESMITRDVQAKDASRSIPGFGGLLDVMDSILFAAPVAYWWFVGFE
jgi:phosphatidate cytidylyltransferase